jgi:hypothetical protein
MKMSMEVGGKILTGQNRITLSNTCSSTTLNIIHPLVFIMEATRVVCVVGTECSCVITLILVFKIIKDVYYFSYFKKENWETFGNISYHPVLKTKLSS